MKKWILRKLQGLSRTLGQSLGTKLGKSLRANNWLADFSRELIASANKEFNLGTMAEVRKAIPLHPDDRPQTPIAKQHPDSKGGRHFG